MSLQEPATNAYSEPIAYSDKLESFGLVDGPGVRSILFLSGCPLRCLYCHNPEMQNPSCGNKITPLEAYNKLIRYKRYWGEKGGITVSGGEPLMSLDFLISLGELAKKDNISFVIDTSGIMFNESPEYLEKFDKLLEVSNLFLLDLKGIDNDLHRKITGKDNTNILALYQYLNKKNFPIWVRYVLVPGLTDSEDLLIRSKQFLKQFPNIQRVEVLPYHSMAIPKYEELHRDYLLKDTPTPSKEEVDRANKLLNTDFFNGYLKNN